MSRPYAQLGIIVAAGGSSSRFGKDNKLLQDLQGLPLFCHCLRNIFSTGIPEASLLVVPEGSQSNFQRLLHANLPLQASQIQVIAGGATRTASVLAGLQALPESCCYVAILDAARPLSSSDLLLRCLASAREFGSGVAAHRLTDTIKQADADGKVLCTLDRNTLWATETPQVFQRDLLQKAYRHSQLAERTFTDDAQLLEEAGFPIHLSENLNPNPKITFHKDLQIMTGNFPDTFIPES